jgi:hypothetical protein
MTTRPCRTRICLATPCRHPVRGGGGAGASACGWAWVRDTARMWPIHSHRVRPLAALGAALLLLAACTSTIRVTDPPRTATEQFLLSHAAMEAVAQLAVEPLRGRRVFLDSEYFAASEAAFVLGELRAKLLMEGVQLTRARDEAQIILEVRSGGVGIDRSDFLLGLPSMLISAGDADGDTGARVPIVTPELAIMKNINQIGVASVAFVAYWADTGEVVATSGPHIGRALREDWWFAGFGPRTVGTVPTTEPPESPE